MVIYRNSHRSKEIESRSTKRHKKNIPVLFFCSVLPIKINNVLKISLEV